MKTQVKTKKQVAVLRVLYTLRGLSCQQIGQILDRNPAAVRNQLALLEGRGLITRSGHPARWGLTDRGRKAYRTWGGMQTDLLGGSHDPERKEP